MDWIPPGVRTSDRPLDLAAASRDLWPGGTLDFWQGRDSPLPDRVAWPRDEAEVEALVRAAAARGVAVVPYGAGSGVCGGARGRPGSLVLDTKAMDCIGPLDRERWTVEAGPGVLGQHLEDWLNARGFTLGHSPSSIWCSSVGGWAAARSAGQFSSRYGVFEDMVLSMRAVSPSRGAFQVGEGGDAPDAWLEMLLGSEGTLGIITSVKMRVWPLPAVRELRGWRFPDVESAVRAMRRLMQGELWPAVVRLYDPVDTRIGGRTRPEKRDKERQHAFYREWLAAIDGMPSVRKRLLALPLALPGLVNRVFDGLASGCLLVVGWEGDADVVRAASDAGRAVLSEEGEDLGPDPGERWFHSRHHVSYKLMPIFERGGFADTMEVACRWSDLVGVYDAVRAALSRTAIVMAHMSHVYPEGGSIYFSFAGRGDPDVYRRTWKAALEAVLAAGGTVTHHHGVGELKAEAASAEIGPAVAGWRAAKAELDPDGILNPGRLFVDTAPVEPRPIDPRPDDHLAIGPAAAPYEARRDALWPWEALPGPQRWCRQPWQAAWIEVEGRVDGQRCVLGRGPRSAAGPDLRPWLAAQDPGARVTWAVAPEGPRWMGEGRVERPWAVALELLRSDLRPAVLTVVGGALRVGFRGPAAAAMGAIASRRVAGGLSEVPYAPEPLPSGTLEPCSVDDPGIVAVNMHGGLRRRGSR
jgi:alkyldihydroxyacetonephosphate synthase